MGSDAGPQKAPAPEPSAKSLRANRRGSAAAVVGEVYSQNRRYSFELVIERTQPGPQFVYTIAVSTGRGVKRNLKHLGNLFEREVFPEFQVHNGSLIRRQLTERRRQRFPKSAFVRVTVRSEGGEPIGAKLFMVFTSRAASPP